jgi:D-amino peptidase
MKIYISSDLEGTTGIVDWEETNIDQQSNRYFSEQMTREVAAACEGAIEGGACEVIVKDAHDSARNINPAKLPDKTKLIRGWMRNPLSMMGGIDETFDGVAFTGYHSAAGTNGNPLAHTMNRNNMYVKINGEYASEFLINSYIAAYYKVPVLFLSGDKLLCESATKLTKNIRTVAVSEGVGNASISINPFEAVEKIKTELQEAVLAASIDKQKFMIELPESFKVEVCFKEHFQAYKGGFYPKAKHVGHNIVQFEAQDYMDVLRFFHFVL